MVAFESDKLFQHDVAPEPEMLCRVCGGLVTKRSHMKPRVDQDGRLSYVEEILFYACGRCGLMYEKLPPGPAASKEPGHG